MAYAPELQLTRHNSGSGSVSTRSRERRTDSASRARPERRPQWRAHRPECTEASRPGAGACYQGMAGRGSAQSSRERSIHPASAILLPSLARFSLLQRGSWLSFSSTCVSPRREAIPFLSFLFCPTLAHRNTRKLISLTDQNSITRTFAEILFKYGPA